jgi:uncharacterized membrane protein YobD (UPF0266 family)
MLGILEDNTHHNGTASWVVFAVLMAGVVAYLTYQTADYIRIRRRNRAAHGATPTNVEARRHNRIQVFMASLPIVIILILNGAMDWSGYPADSRTWLVPLDLLAVVAVWLILRRWRQSLSKKQSVR